MNRILSTLVVLPIFSSVAGLIPKYGPEGAPRATLLRNDSDYVRQSPNSDYWSLSPYYVGMRGGHSASAASVVMVLNALRKDTKYSSSDELVTESGLLSKLPKEKWADKLSGEKPVGVDLARLATLAQESLAAYGVSGGAVRAIRIVDASDKTLDRVRQQLIENEKSDRDFVIANYLQSAFTHDPEGAVGTYSPVAAFDAAKDRVLVFETDRTYYEPYWVSLKDFVSGLSQLKGADKKPTGGLIVLSR